MPVKLSSGTVAWFCVILRKNHAHHGPFIPVAAAMKLHGPQEMQARANSALSSSSIHLAVVTENSAPKVHGMNKTLSSFLPEFLPPGCDEIITTFGDSKTNFPRHGKAMQGEVGVIKPAITGDRFSPLGPTRYEGG